MRNTFKKWELLIRVDADMEKKLMDYKRKTNLSYNEIINESLKHFFDGANKSNVNTNDGGKI